MQKTLYVGLDVRKASISITTAEEGRDGEVRFIGTIPNTSMDIAKLAKRLANEGRRLAFCYEAGGFTDNSSISATAYGGRADTDCPQAR